MYTLAEYPIVDSKKKTDWEYATRVGMVHADGSLQTMFSCEQAQNRMRRPIRGMTNSSMWIWARTKAPGFWISQYDALERKWIMLGFETMDAAAMALRMLHT